MKELHDDGHWMRAKAFGWDSQLRRDNSSEGKSCTICILYSWTVIYHRVGYDKRREMKWKKKKKGCNKFYNDELSLAIAKWIFGRENCKFIDIDVERRCLSSRFAESWNCTNVQFVGACRRRMIVCRRRLAKSNAKSNKLETELVTELSLPLFYSLYIVSAGHLCF